MSKNEVKFPIKESFSWLMPDFKISQGAGNKINIKGRALYADVKSKNLRKYVEEEVIKSARTFVGKPITVNHDSKKIVGHIVDADYEDGALEYMGEINQEPYVSRLRDKLQYNMTEKEYFKKWGLQPISAVSIDADYRKNRCTRCGEDFYDMETFQSHMHEDHGVHSQFEVEPRGIFGKGISLVEDPEHPGIASTTVGLFETVYKWTAPESGHSRLLETVTNDVKNMVKKREVGAVTSTSRIPAVPSSIKLEEKKISEEDPEQEPEPCPEGQHRNEEGKCVPDEEATEQEECPEGQHRNEEGKCVPDEPEATEQEDCPEGQHRNEEGECVPDEKAEEQEEEQCPEGFHKNEEGECVPDKVEEIKLAKLVVEKLSLGEPFADYEGMADCVASNQDKPDPEAYCLGLQKADSPASEVKISSLDEKLAREQEELKHEYVHKSIQEANKLTRRIVSRYGKDISKLSQRLKDIDSKVFKMGEHSNTVIEAVDRLTESFSKSLTDVVKKTRGQYLGIFQRNRENKKLGEKSRKKLGEQIATGMARSSGVEKDLLNKITQLSVKIKPLKTELTSKIDELKTQFEPLKTEIEAKITELSSKFDKEKEESDNNLSEIKKRIEEEEEQRKQSLKETEDWTTRLDNLESKLKEIKTLKGTGKELNEGGSGLSKNPWEEEVEK